MKNRQFIINHPSQLNSLSTLPFIHRNGLGRIAFNDTFQHADREQMEKDLNRYYHACGCNLGAKGLLIGLLVFGAVGIYGFYNYDWSVTKSITWFLGGAIALSLLGKLIGLGLANGKLKKTIKEIQSAWKPDWPAARAVDCG